jgi:hypothetical protein
MSSRRKEIRQRNKLSRAEIKAYEARRAEERRRLALHEADDEPEISGSMAYTISRDDEYAVIKSDLVRLGWIVGILLALLVVATILLV